MSRSLYGKSQRGNARPLCCAVAAMSQSMPAGWQAERRAVCVERRTHGSEGGVGRSSQEATRAYPMETLFRGSVHESPPARLRAGTPLVSQKLQFKL